MKACLRVRFLIFMRLIVTPDNTCHDVPYISKPLHIIFGNVDEYIKKYNGQKYLRLFPPDQEYEKIFDRIQNLIIQKSSTSDVKIKISSDKGYFWE